MTGSGNFVIINCYAISNGVQDGLNYYLSSSINNVIELWIIFCYVGVGFRFDLELRLTLYFITRMEQVFR